MESDKTRRDKQIPRVILEILLPTLLLNSTRNGFVAKVEEVQLQLPQDF